MKKLLFFSFFFLVCGDVEDDWPCPAADSIAPCMCSFQSYKIQISCDNVVELSELRRIFSQPFPFDNLDTVVLMNNDVNLWNKSEPLEIPADFFCGKKIRNIWIYVKVSEVHEEAFVASHEILEELSISGGTNIDSIQPLEM